VKTALIASIGVGGLVVGIQSAAAQYQGSPGPARVGPDPYANSLATDGMASGPKQRGAGCVVVNDSTRNYGYMKECPAPKGGSPKAATR
jgi:hypothetical protein